MIGSSLTSITQAFGVLWEGQENPPYGNRKYNGNGSFDDEDPLPRLEAQMSVELPRSAAVQAQEQFCSHYLCPRPEHPIWLEQ